MAIKRKLSLLRTATFHPYRILFFTIFRISRNVGGLMRVNSSLLPALYTTYADWWPLLSAPEDYAEDAAAYIAILRGACTRPLRTLLELGSGGGNNASFMKSHFTLTLTDLAPAMLDVSRRLNPECEHLCGDMRTLRLKRQFDAVFIHDAIVYMATPDDLARAVKTAFVHCRPGGTALFVPDYTTETFRPATCHGGCDTPGRAMRYLQWDSDPDPDDGRYRIDFAYLFRDSSTPVRFEHETHECGLFPIRQWHAILQQAGFEPDSVTIETEDLESGYYRLFIGHRPAGRPARLQGRS